tara:strand:+ start:186 stop:425 length:240 start_codon:yes stop_codon:yes gene_type:complete
MFFYVSDSADADTTEAESYSVSADGSRVLLCFIGERPSLGSAMTGAEAQKLVNENRSEWSRFSPSESPEPPPGWSDPEP